MAARSKYLGLAFVSPWLAAFVLFTSLPVLLSLYFSLCDYPVLQRSIYLGADNYRDMASDPWFYNALGNTLKYAAMVLPAGLLFSLGLALLLNENMAGQYTYR